MSFTAEIEHIWMPPDQLPVTLQGMFKDGACTVFSNEEFTAAIPATDEETSELADLLEIAATGGASPDEPAMVAYYALRDRLCGENGYQMLSLLFKQEMDRLRRSQQLASAARYN